MKEKLHWISGSPNSWRVLLLLEYKNIAFESLRIDPSVWKREESGFLALNRRGKVPVLEDGDLVLCESLAIMQYLDKKYPADKLFGSSAREIGLISQRISEVVHYIAEPMYLLSRHLMKGILHESLENNQNTADTIYSELSKVEQWLEEGNYFNGEKLAASDLYFYPIIAFLERISSIKEESKLINLKFLPLSEKLPKIKAWMQRIEEIPRFTKTIPPHWRGE